MIFCIFERVKWVWVKENGESELRYERVPINTTSVYKCIASSRTDRRIYANKMHLLLYIPIIIYEGIERFEWITIRNTFLAESGAISAS